jgi:hypothetical protein
MTAHHIDVSAEIKAPAGQIYGILADYRHGHPRILPKPPFLDLEVEAGGVGAGTAIRFSMRVMGRTRRYRATITEPEPGRVLRETDPASGVVTTFTVDSLAGGHRSRVTIATEINTRSGLLGILERAFITRYLRPIYRCELANLAALVEGP